MSGCSPSLVPARNVGFRACSGGALPVLTTDNGEHSWVQYFGWCFPFKLAIRMSVISPVSSLAKQQQRRPGAKPILSRLRACRPTPVKRVIHHLHPDGHIGTFRTSQKLRRVERRVRLRVRPLHRILISLVLRGFSYLSVMPLLAPSRLRPVAGPLNAFRPRSWRLIPSTMRKNVMPPRARP
jgi:hypothetical protein